MQKQSPVMLNENILREDKVDTSNPMTGVNVLQ